VWRMCSYSSLRISSWWFDRRHGRMMVCFTIMVVVVVGANDLLLRRLCGREGRVETLMVLFCLPVGGCVRCHSGYVGCWPWPWDDGSLLRDIFVVLAVVTALVVLA
jgi:hypothetical protein